MLSRRIATTLAAATVLVLATGTGSALAASVGKAGDTVTYSVSPGEVNDLTVTVSGDSYVFDEAARSVSADPGCTANPDGTASCPVSGTVVISVALGDEDDRLVASSIGARVLVNGGPGADTATTGTGDDTFDGEGGRDTFDGGPGDDVLQGGVDADTLTGGAGFDLVDYSDRLAAEPVTVTLDDQANDGEPGENDAITTVEDITGGGGDDRLTGDAFYNVLTGTGGNDTIDPAGGEDVASGESGDDTFLVRDGFADRVLCGPGVDTVTADQLDRVESDCESVSVADTAVAREDRPPTVSFAGPSANAFLPTASASTITALAADDRGVAEVQLVDDGRIVATDTTAPYTFQYRPRGDDVGRNTLVLVAVDTAGQTASAVRPLRVARFAPRALVGTVTPTRDRFAPFEYRTKGRIRLPRGVTRLQGCGKGRVSVQVKRGSKTISSRRVALGKKCGFSSRVVFYERSRVGRGTLRFVVRFLGNSVLIPRSGLTLRARTR